MLKNSLSQLGEAVNETNLLAKVGWLIQKVKQHEAALNKKPTRTKLTRYEPAVLESMSDDKIWNLYALIEDIAARYPEYPAPNRSSLNATLAKMTLDNKLERVGGKCTGAYRIKK